MSSHLARIGIITVAGVVLFLVGYLFLPKLALCTLFCWWI